MRYAFYAPAPGVYTTSDAGLRVQGEKAGDKAGWAVTGADLDGDGRGELVVGAPGEATGGPAAGAVYIFSL